MENKKQWLARAPHLDGDNLLGFIPVDEDNLNAVITYDDLTEWCRIKYCMDLRLLVYEEEWYALQNQV